MAKVPKDLLQPSDPEFKKVYKKDPISEKMKEMKEAKRKKGEKKAKLEEKYWKMKKEGKIKPWEEKDLKKIVLQERVY